MGDTSCSVCGARLWLNTDGPCGLGIVHAVHPPVPCVPRVIVYEHDDAEDDFANCVSCKKLFEKAMTKQRFCSDRCKKSRNHYERDRKRKEVANRRARLERERQAILARWGAA